MCQALTDSEGIHAFVRQSALFHLSGVGCDGSRVPLPANTFQLLLGAPESSPGEIEIHHPSSGFLVNPRVSSQVDVWWEVPRRNPNPLPHHLSSPLRSGGSNRNSLQESELLTLSPQREELLLASCLFNTQSSWPQVTVGP